MFDEKPTRTRETFAAYRKVAERLCDQAVREGGQGASGVDATMLNLVVWFLAAHGRWAPSTIRFYKAAIQAVLEKAVRKHPDIERLQTSLDRLRAEPAPAPRVGGTPRTSARKRKSDTPAEVDAVLAALADASHPAAAVAHGLLLYGHDLGLRPGEWAHASIVGDNLVVPNAKATNGRANGEARSLGLTYFPQEYVSALAGFLTLLAAALAEKSWAKEIYPAARGQLRAACKRAAARVPSLRNRPLSFYTGRHVVAGRAKARLPRDGVAALLGHATDRTATTSYARARSVRGWSPVVAEPDVRQIATVKASFREMKVTATPTTPKPQA
jgi:integrase